CARPQIKIPTPNVNKIKLQLIRFIRAAKVAVTRQKGQSENTFVIPRLCGGGAQPLSNHLRGNHLFT
ncbi:MAG TPA: hypothetical protein VGI88_00395, partial [Verrucomicrobiae bacterium]